MARRRTLVGGLIAAAAVAALFAPSPLAASADPRTAPAEVTRAFVQATVDRDVDAACALVSQTQRDEMAAAGAPCETVLTELAQQRDRIATYRQWLDAGIAPDAVTITGDRAYVSLPPTSVATLGRTPTGGWTIQSLN